MLKYEIKTVTEKKELITDCICNKCSKSLKDDQGLNYEGLVGAVGRGGYASRIGDEVYWRFDMCEECLLELFNTFEHSPFVED